MSVENYFKKESPTEKIGLHIPLKSFFQVRTTLKMLTLAQFRSF